VGILLCVCQPGPARPSGTGPTVSSSRNSVLNLTERGLLPILTGPAMQAWEASVFAEGAIEERVVLESAGRAVASAIATHFPEGRVVGAIGGGNNGADAVVALRTLKALGRDVAAFGSRAVIDRSALTHGWELPFHDSPEDACGDASVVVDGLLGTGASGPVRESTATLIEVINAAGRPVVAVDGPSGVDLATGRVGAVAVRAALTVTFGAIKQGLLLFPGREHAGRILLAEVGFPPMDSSLEAAAMSDAWARHCLPRVAPDAHKGRMGLVAVVAGRHGFAGAAIMASMAALRAGTGGVRLVSTEDNRALLQAAVPEAVFIARSDSALEARLKGTTAIVIGPGVGTDDDAAALLERILTLQLPAVVDADAITLLASRPDLRGRVSRAHCVLTPHPAELGRLLGCSTEDVLADRPATARAAAADMGAVVLAKGAPSLVALPDGRVLFGTTGHSGLATGGMGDTLAGVIGAFLGSGLAPGRAAGAGLHFAGRAAEAAGKGRGLLPRDVAEALPGALFANAEAPMAPPFLFDLAAPI
jgi:hydroxyethylthiazole kinase-like uncharacterized protein yjeF